MTAQPQSIAHRYGSRGLAPKGTTPRSCCRDEKGVFLALFPCAGLPRSATQDESVEDLSVIFLPAVAYLGRGIRSLHPLSCISPSATSPRSRKLRRARTIPGRRQHLRAARGGRDARGVRDTDPRRKCGRAESDFRRLSVTSETQKNHAAGPRIRPPATTAGHPDCRDPIATLPQLSTRHVRSGEKMRLKGDDVCTCDSFAGDEESAVKMARAAADAVKIRPPKGDRLPRRLRAQAGALDPSRSIVTAFEGSHVQSCPQNPHLAPLPLPEPSVLSVRSVHSYRARGISNRK